MIEDGAFSDTQDIPKAFQVCFVFILHGLEPLVDLNNLLLNILDLQLNKSRDTLLQIGISQFFITIHYLFSLFLHYSMHFIEGNILQNLMTRYIKGRLVHIVFYLSQDPIVVLDYLL